MPALLIALVLIVVVSRQLQVHEAPNSVPGNTNASRAENSRTFDPAFIRPRPSVIAATPYLTGTRAALGSENGALTYNAQPFLVNRHLGDDLNGIGGWNSDYADPVFSIGNGLVIYAGTPSTGWGKSLSVMHRPNPDDATAVIQSFYSHLSELHVAVGDLVACGDLLGNVGDADGRYLAHLHLELRKGTSGDPGDGYHDTSLNRISPSVFLQAIPDSPSHLLRPAVLSIISGSHASNQPVNISETSATPASTPQALYDSPGGPGHAAEPPSVEQESVAREPQQ